MGSVDIYNVHRRSQIHRLDSSLDMRDTDYFLTLWLLSILLLSFYGELSEWIFSSIIHDQLQ